MCVYSLVVEEAKGVLDMCKILRYVILRWPVRAFVSRMPFDAEKFFVATMCDTSSYTCEIENKINEKVM